MQEFDLIVIGGARADISARSARERRGCGQR